MPYILCTLRSSVASNNLINNHSRSSHSASLTLAVPRTIHISLKLLHLDRFSPPNLNSKMSEPQTTQQAAAAQPAAAVPETQTQTAAPTAAEEPMTIPVRFPGDNILTDADTVYDQRKTIKASPEDVWPWLVQWGKGRGGWYVPSKVEKVLPEKYRSAPTINPEWQTLKAGDRVPDYGLKKKDDAEHSLEVVLVESQRALVYQGQRLGQNFTWALLLETPSGSAAGTNSSSGDSIASATETVLHLRFRSKSQTTGWKAKVTSQLGKVADGMLASAMFPGIADRVEQQEKTQKAKATA